MRARQFIFEYNQQATIQRFGDKLLATAKKDPSPEISSVYNLLNSGKEIDPNTKTNALITIMQALEAAEIPYVVAGMNPMDLKRGIDAAVPSPEIEPHLPEVVLRFGVRSQDRKMIERFTREIPPLALSGPPVASGLGLGRPQVEEIIAFWPALIPKSEVHPEVTIWRSDS